jgi:hypothetical protein
MAFSAAGVLSAYLIANSLPDEVDLDSSVFCYREIPTTRRPLSFSTVMTHVRPSFTITHDSRWMDSVLCRDVVLRTEHECNATVSDVSSTFYFFA